VGSHLQVLQHRIFFDTQIGILIYSLLGLLDSLNSDIIDPIIVSCRNNQFIWCNITTFTAKKIFCFLSNVRFKWLMLVNIKAALPQSSFVEKVPSPFNIENFFFKRSFELLYSLLLVFNFCF